MFPPSFSELVMYSSIIMGHFIEYFIDVCNALWGDPLMLLSLGICLVVGIITIIKGLLWG